MKTFDYIKIYAEALKKDKNVFKQHKMLIDSQIKASQSLFGHMTKEEKRSYLKGRGLI